MRFILGGDGPVSPQDRAEIDQRHDRIQREADPAILARIFRIEHHGMLPRPRRLPRAMQDMTTHFDDPLHQWHTGYLSVRDVDLPDELMGDLKQCVPQATLRDVFRPTTQFEFRFEPPEEDADPLGERTLREAKAALVREPVPVIETGVTAMIRERKRRQRFVNRPWQTPLADDQPRQYARVEGVFYREVDEDGEPIEQQEE